MYIHLYNLGNGYFLQSVYWFVSTYIIVNLNLAALYLLQYNAMHCILQYTGTVLTAEFYRFLIPRQISETYSLTPP